MNRSRVVVVTPTYNERANLPVLVERICDLKIPHLCILVVDDNSPDGTGLVADELARRFPITVLHRRRKLGIGPAYVEAFKRVLAEGVAEYILQMDADLSHDPADIPRLLEAAETCDLVLGSRYVKGGRTHHWGLLRRLVSRTGTLYSRLVLSLPYRDLTGGFKCFRRSVLAAIDLDDLSSIGYNFQIEMTYAAHAKGFRICEIPILFVERTKGRSKFDGSIVVESFCKVLALRLRGILDRRV